MSVRVRYAPSPTGLQHIGGLRTALFNYFFARSRGGTFILRIEDTDQERYHEDALRDIYDTFAWLGIRWDEGPDTGGPFGPYFQSQRTEIYREYARKLMEQGNAYECFCTSERLEALRGEQAAGGGGVSGYDRHCRNLSPEEVSRRREQGIGSVIRLKVPLEGATRFHDVLLGDIERMNTDINPDPVLLKSDGFPTYHLANVIDDHLMEVTHILRAQEWIPSGALHVLLYEAFGWQPPIYCHLPMVMGSDGQKLSKRHGATSVQEFRKSGYLPEAVINYVSLLGWSYDDQREFFSKEDLSRLFTLDRLNKAPAVFDYKKLEWFNGNYIRQKSDGELANLLLPYLQGEGMVEDPPTEAERALVLGAVPLIRERIRFLSEAPEMMRFLFRDPGTYVVADLIPKKMNAEETLRLVEALDPELEGIDVRSDEENEERFRDAAERLGTKLGNLLMPLRVAVTGSRVSPPLFGSIRLLGSETVRRRLARVRNILKEEIS